MMQGFSGAPLSDAAAWDAYVAAHPHATPFHSRAWCEAVTRATGHQCHLVTARDANGTLTGLLPLHHVRSPLFGQALVGSGGWLRVSSEPGRGTEVALELPAA